MPEDDTTQSQDDDKNNDSNTSEDQQENNSNNSDDSEGENKNEEVVFHPHKGKIMQIKPYTLIHSLSFDQSYGSPTGDGSVELNISNKDKKYIYSGVSCKLKIRRDTDVQFSPTGIEEVYAEKDIKLREHIPTYEQVAEYNTILQQKQFVYKDYKDYDVNSTIVSRSASDDGLYGFVCDVKHTSESSKLSLKDWGLALENIEKELEFKGLLRSHVIEEVAKSYGLTPIVDLTGLEDDIIDWSNKKTVNSNKGSSKSSDDDGASVNGDGSMTEDQAWDIYKTFVYGGWGSGHDPQKAWEKMGTTKGAKADCYDATAWMYYVYNYKIGIPARDICYPSAAARNSGTHHIVQIYKNGKWFVPEQYHGITSGLGGSEQSKYHVCRDPPKNGNQPEYKKCPWSRND